MTGFTGLTGLKKIYYRYISVLFTRYKGNLNIKKKKRIKFKNIILILNLSDAKGVIKNVLLQRIESFYDIFLRSTG